MKIVFISNFLNHHQLPLSLSLYNNAGAEYTFVATQPIPDEQLRLGYEDMNKKYPFVITTYDSDVNLCRAREIIDECDIAIIGSASEKWVKKRAKMGKIIFRYSERPLKNGNKPLKYLLRFIKWHLTINHGRSVYLLCASAYTSADFKKFKMFGNRTYKWGYFPEVKVHENIDALLEKKKRNSIMWAGRMIDWKHPEYALQVAKRLKEEGYKFTLNMVGNGNRLQELEEMIEKEKLTDCVNLLGSMPPDEVREHMENSQIYLFTSNFKEGWGAVLNEAMNSGCAVVASHSIGSVPFLIKDKENGLIYRNEDVDNLYSKVKYLLDNQEEISRLGKCAYLTMKNEWNAESAAERLLEFGRKILSGDEKGFDEGPLSRAEIIENDWM